MKKEKKKKQQKLNGARTGTRRWRGACAGVRARAQLVHPSPSECTGTPLAGAVRPNHSPGAQEPLSRELRVGSLWLSSALVGYLGCSGALFRLPMLLVSYNDRQRRHIDGWTFMKATPSHGCHFTTETQDNQTDKQTDRRTSMSPTTVRGFIQRQADKTDQTDRLTDINKTDNRSGFHNTTNTRDKQDRQTAGDE